MNKFVRYYNQNKKMIWGIVIIIASIIIVLQLLNSLVGNRIENDAKNATEVQNIDIETNSSTINTDKSAISGGNINQNQLQREVSTIDNFITYCNNKEIEKAYNMLTNECKENMYTSLQVFAEAYYNDNFDGQTKKAEIENWMGSTYKVRLTDDILATGKSTNGYAKQDYITIKEENDDYKLNINSYIGYSEINKVTEQNDIKIEVLSKNTYMENEEYKIRVTNNTNGTIMLDDLRNVDSLYLESSGSTYSYYSHELTEEMLTISSKETKEVTIKFYSYFASGKQINNIVFSNLKIDYKSTNQNTIIFKANV